MGEVVALVLARGLGRRMQQGSVGALTAGQRAAADAGLKSLVPMSAGTERGRPFLDYVLGAVADAGFQSVALVVAPDHEALARQYTGTSRPTRFALTFVVQEQPLGTADAVRSAEAFVAHRPFVVLNADNLYPVDVLRALGTLDGPGLPAFERDELVRSSGLPADRVGTFALLTVSPAGTLLDIVEKPGVEAVSAAGARALVSMNCWRFDDRIFPACRDVRRSPRGEFELPEAVRLAVTRGVPFRVLPAVGPVLDLSRREDVPDVAARLAGRDVRL